MSRRQVYGKRSRAIYDPLAAFASPQRTPPNNTEALKDANLKEETLGRATQCQKLEKRRVGRRKPLTERSANGVINADFAIDKETKPKRPQRRKVIVEEDEEAEESKQTKKVDGIRKSDIRRCQGNRLSDRFQEQEQHWVGVGADEVPLFYKGHGYESDDDNDTVVPLREENPGCNETKELESEPQQSSHLEPPSITILPPTPPLLDESSEHCASLLQLSSHPMSEFLDWSKQLTNHFDITKIAEASFGEVYRLSLRQQIPEFSSNDESVFKIIALRSPDTSLAVGQRKLGATKSKADNMSRPEDVANEVKLLQRMSAIPGFTNFRDVRVVKGRPPQPFAKAYKAFNASQKARKKEPSNFPDPGKKANYSEDQLWAVIEMQDAGTDLECLVERGQSSTTSIFFVWDIFWQVVLSLAKGESGAEFEHRDLHLGNICVRQPLNPNPATLVDTKRKLNFTGLETTIIDYTISRATMPDGTVAYHDLARDSSGIFEGDSTEEYQYDIYRYMRGALFFNDPYITSSLPNTPTLEDNQERSWEQYHPLTNLIWLHFLLYKLLEQVDWPSSQKAPPRKQKAAHAEWKRGNDLEHVLLRVQELLYPDVVCAGEIKCASDLVGLALTEGWVDDGDVVGGDGFDDVDEEEVGLVEKLGELSLQSLPFEGVSEDDAARSAFVMKTRH